MAFRRQARSATPLGFIEVACLSDDTLTISIGHHGTSGEGNDLAKDTRHPLSPESTRKEAFVRLCDGMSRRLAAQHSIGSLGASLREQIEAGRLSGKHARSKQRCDVVVIDCHDSSMLSCTNDLGLKIHSPSQTEEDEGAVRRGAPRTSVSVDGRMTPSAFVRPL